MVIDWQNMVMIIIIQILQQQQNQSIVICSVDKQQMIEDKVIKNDQQNQTGSQPVQQNVQSSFAQVPLSPDLFLFQQIVIDILNHCKRNLKVHPFDDMQVDKLVQSNKNQSIDIYQQYFLVGVGSSKTREYVCNKYEQLVRDKLINKDFLPPQMITGIINARPVGTGGGGSTASSGSNSIVGSAMNLNTDKSYNIGKLVSSIICNTLQPSSEISAGLAYLLEGSRNKNNGSQFSQLIQDTYANLSEFKKKPIDRFLNHFLKGLINQIEHHQAPYFQYEKKYLNQRRKLQQQRQNLLNNSLGNYKKVPSIMQQSNIQSVDKLEDIPQPPPMHQFIKKTKPDKRKKQDMCQHADEDAKFGKCFICERGASNYDKVLYVPLCGMECKNKLRRINQQCIMNDHFNFMKWLLETLTQNNTGDQVLYTLLLREVEGAESLSEQQIGIILGIIVNNFSLQSIGINIGIQAIQTATGVNGLMGNKIIQNSAMIMSHLVRKYTALMFESQNLDHRQDKKKQIKEDMPPEYQKIQQKIVPNFFHTKVIVIEMVRMLQSLPILNTSLQLTLLRSLMEILTARSPILGNQSPIIVVKQLYVKCDCHILQTNIVQRVFNLISQYALQSNTSPATYNSNANNQNIGTNTSLTLDSTNAISLGVINNVSIGGTNCTDVAISGLQQILNSLVQTMEYFDAFNCQIQKRQEDRQIINNIIKQKRVKSYIQTKFVQDFNKKPGKAVDKLRKLFDNQISAKDIAILIRQNMDYETKIKKIQQKINKQQVGTFFGTAKKDKNKDAEKQDFNQKVYWEFLKLLQKQYKGRQIDDCLRITFNSFMMPKQGQQVQVVLGPLSLALEPHLGLKQGNQATATYQLIMVALMVQTSNNPNVKQNQKLKFEGFKNFCSQIDKDLSEARMTQIYERIKKRPLQILMQYKGADVFQKKYLSPKDLQTQFWKNLQDQSILQVKDQQKEKPKEKLDQSMSESMSSFNMSMTSSTITVNTEAESKYKNEQKPQKSQKLQKTEITQQAQVKQQQTISQGKQSPKKLHSQQNQKHIESKESLNMQSSMVLQIPQQRSESLLGFALQNLWQFGYMSLVNKNNLRGLEQACILYGKCELNTQFQAFFNNLYKLHKDYSQKSSSTLQAISNQSKLIILKLAIDFSNYVIGRQSWLIIIKIIYKLDYDQQQNIKPATSRKLESSYAFYQNDSSDKLFTRTNTFRSERLKQFLQAMCEFSSSQAKTDRKYTRQMYILHHIAQIIQYNLQRFQLEDPDKKQKNLWNVVWPTIRNYFRNICIHPRKQIAMSAIDSYKQLTMKMLKVNPIEQGHINHSQLMNVYLYVFERSPAYIKDLIINVLLNVVSRDMRSGWNEIYTILEISDSEDKTVVMKVINRLAKDIGLQNVSNLIKLHQILIKQLRIAYQDGYSQIMNRLWEVCDHFNRIDIWLETLAKVKDIYKSTSDVKILVFLYKICNHCIKMAYQKDNTDSLSDKNKNEGKQKKNSKKMKTQQNQQNGQQQTIQKIGKIQDAISTKYLHEALADNQYQNNHLQQLKSQQIHKLVYFEVFSVQMHILQIKSSKLFADSVNIFKQLNLDVFFRNLGNSEQNKTGFISLWEMFLTCNNSIHFCYFLHDYFGIVWQELALIEIALTKNQKQQRQDYNKMIQQFHSIKNLQQLYYIKKHILLWLIRTCMESSKDQILQLTEEDPDLKKTFKQIIQQQQASSGKTELIQFYFSSKQYECKSIQHLVFLKIFKLYFQSQFYVKQQQKQHQIDQAYSLNDIHQRVLQLVVESYETASQINSKPLLRNFLWDNQFFKGQDYLPGLMKQQLRAFQLIVKYFSLEDLQGKVYKLIYNFILSFIDKTNLLLPKNSKSKLKQVKQQPKMPFKIITGGNESQNPQILKIIKILYQDLGLWITNAQQVILQTLRKLACQIKKSQMESQKSQIKYINFNQLFTSCLQLSQVTASSSITKQCSCVLEELTLKMF